jgi:type III secretory pathway component EscS
LVIFEVAVLSAVIGVMIALETENMVKKMSQIQQRRVEAVILIVEVGVSLGLSLKLVGSIWGEGKHGERNKVVYSFF